MPQWGEMWEPESLVVIGLTFFVAGAVKGVIGMGLPTISLALLAATLGLHQAMALLLFPSFGDQSVAGAGGARAACQPAPPVDVAGGGVRRRLVQRRRPGQDRYGAADRASRRSDLHLFGPGPRPAARSESGPIRTLAVAGRRRRERRPYRADRLVRRSRRALYAGARHAARRPCSGNGNSLCGFDRRPRRIAGRPPATVAGRRRPVPSAPRSRRWSE